MAGAVIRIISGEIDFSAYMREHSVPVYTNDQRSLIDLSLCFYAMPSCYEWISGRELLGVEDIRLYISGQNVTESLKTEIKRLISAVPLEILRSSYLAGARSHIAFVKSLGMYLTEMQNDEHFVERYVLEDNWPFKFDLLGSRRIGWMGNLHPINYLFRNIPLVPISLKRVWETDQAARNAQPVPLSVLDPLVITVSQGPAPSYEAFDPKAFVPAGRIVYQLEASLKNPLEAPLREITSRLTTLSMQVDTIRTRYMDVIAGQVDQMENDLKSSADGLTEGLRRLQQTVDQIKGA